MGSSRSIAVLIRQRLEAAAAGGALGGLGALPGAYRYRLAGALAAAATGVDRRHYRIARESLILRYGPERAGQRARAAFRELGHLLAEVPLLEGCASEAMPGLVTAVEGQEHLDAAVADPRGTLVLTGHVGNWEIMGHVLIQYGLAPLHGIYRPLENPYLDARLRATRGRSGAGTISRWNASRPVLQALRKGEAVAVLPDQFPRGKGRIWLPFLGEATQFQSAPVRLALRSGAPILPVFLLREGVERFRLVAFPRIEPGDYPDDDNGVRDLGAAMVAALEVGIARAPAQWFWFHRRWRHEPRALIEGGPPPPPWGGEVVVGGSEAEAP